MTSDADCDFDAGDARRRGLDLFRGGHYWDAHEEWEDLWQSLPTGTAARRATKALIQLAAICHKPEQAAKNRTEEDMQRGMDRLLTTARAHLDASFECSPPEPPWNRQHLALMLDRMDDLFEQWKQGASLAITRRRIRRAAEQFSL